MQPMVDALSLCFWKTSKNDVLEQLGIPPQSITAQTLTFSPVEQHFYMRQHAECSHKFNLNMIKFKDLDIKLKDLDRHTVNVLLKPMLRLRQVNIRLNDVEKILFYY